MEDIIKKHISEGINLYYIPDSKYKTVSMSTYLTRRLSKEEATFNALLAKVLARGTQSAKNINELNIYADNLYGTLYDVNITKKAYAQSIVSSVNFLSDEYTDESIARECTCLMLDLLFKPNVSGDGFPAEVFSVECQNLRDDIEGLINDKRSYANFRCIEEMCEGEENSIFEFGYLEDLDKINASSLYNHYKEIITKSPIDIFVVGSVDIDELVGHISDYLKEFTFDISPVLPGKNSLKARKDIKYVEDVFDVNQGKLAMGFRTNITIDDNRYYALLLANSIFGSGAHSRLFNTVREEMSLCYYASSMLDKFRALMLVSSGIEFENFEKAKTEIEKQLKNIAGGEFTDEELEVARSFIVNSYRSYKDSAYAMKEYYRSHLFSDNHDTIDEAIDKIEAISRDDVTDSLSEVKLDTVYFLKGKDA